MGRLPGSHGVAVAVPWDGYRRAVPASIASSPKGTVSRSVGSDQATTGRSGGSSPEESQAHPARNGHCMAPQVTHQAASAGAHTSTAEKPTALTTTMANSHR